jgi:hypothetical protein
MRTSSLIRRRSRMRKGVDFGGKGRPAHRYAKSAGAESPRSFGNSSGRLVFGCRFRLQTGSVSPNGISVRAVSLTVLTRRSFLWSTAKGAVALRGWHRLEQPVRRSRKRFAFGPVPAGSARPQAHPGSGPMCTTGRNSRLSRLRVGSGRPVRRTWADRGRAGAVGGRTTT